MKLNVLAARMRSQFIHGDLEPRIDIWQAQVAILSPWRGDCIVAPIAASIHTLPAVPTLQRATSAKDAWLGGYRTVRLTSAIEAVRVHVGAGAAASIHRNLAAGAGLHGRWFAVGDVVQTYWQYRAARALPAHFTDIAIATLAPGTILNIGRCGPLFGMPGGGEQVEFVEGPDPVFRTLDAVWSHAEGRA